MLFYNVEEFYFKINKTTKIAVNSAVNVKPYSRIIKQQ